MTDATGERVDRVVAAVTAVDGVIGLYSGGLGVPATHLPGRTVRGVRLGADGGEVHVVLDLRTGLLDVAARVRRAASEAAGVPVVVVVDDVAVAEAQA
ncbi:hypothetical protein DE4585_02819 [Mycobacteroides salmoniphilum]|uniref:Asp23/Gls24 family envelope stress response protein n=2 Tax=Mycobacteroides TaxID=670516 RepID=A0A1S1LD51_9MYCO|nr:MULTISPECIES: hypothetical protein [Mycobacteroides]OHU30872.1 hypothetical protein BKG76_03945 [Mycobacteroides franklinii]QCH22861.1 hypothetical protein DSM43276_01107 [Mycobacteroides salmoniphilum]TDZ79084.1 hypothetical protein DE4585_02819 [Mycobacteroides salmoniphilum]TDZ81170.1 hypothetical protein DE4586_01117 [Mycobacteroides salmoniphilum]TDZ88670.1 hypothetical protein DE4587_01033 [Mycobacteroides salmoniphilum]